MILVLMFYETRKIERFLDCAPAALEMTDMFFVGVPSVISV